ADRSFDHVWLVYPRDRARRAVRCGQPWDGAGVRPDRIRARDGARDREKALKTARKIVLSGEPLVDGPTTLRPWRDSDIQAIVEACQDPEIARWTRVPEQYGEVDARSYLMQRYDSMHAGATAPYAIVATADDERLLGSISLMRLAWEHARA